MNPFSYKVMLLIIITINNMLYDISLSYCVSVHRYPFPSGNKNNISNDEHDKNNRSNNNNNNNNDTKQQCTKKEKNAKITSNTKDSPPPPSLPPFAKYSNHLTYQDKQSPKRTIFNPARLIKVAIPTISLPSPPLKPTFVIVIHTRTRANEEVKENTCSGATHSRRPGMASREPFSPE